MFRAPVLVAAAAVVGLVTACAGARPPSPAAAGRFTDDDRAAVIAVLAAQEAAWNRGDLDGFMAGYLRGPELIFTSGSAIRRGWQETYDKYRARYGGKPETMGRLGFEIVEVQAVGADGAVVLGRWQLTATPSAGSGVFSVVLERRGQGWLVVHDHTSSDPVEPKPPSPASEGP